MSLLHGAAGGPPRGVEITRKTYRGWPGCWELRNASAEMVVVPQIGRILRFGPRGGENLLWENPALWGKEVAPAEARQEWANFGGDKIWPAPQERWSWPPDPWLDGSPWTVRREGPAAIVMESPVSRATGLQVRRRLVMDPARPRVRLKNVLLNRDDRAVEWSVWEVAQVDDPEWCSMPRGEGSAFSRGYRLFPDSPIDLESRVTVGEAVRARRDPTRSYKIGSFSRLPELQSRKGGWTFVLRGPGAFGGAYPDEGCNAEIYSNPDPLAYVELETLGPIQRIEPQRGVVLETVWELRR